MTRVANATHYVTSETDVTARYGDTASDGQIQI